MKRKGIFIPENVLCNKDISTFAKILYGEIAYVCERDGFCRETNTYFAELCGVQKCIISRWIKKFKDKKFLKVRYRGNHNYTRFIFLSTTDKDTIKSIIHTYYTIVPPYKNTLKSIEHQNHALNNNTSFNEDGFDFDDNDMDKWLDNMGVKHRKDSIDYKEEQ